MVRVIAVLLLVLGTAGCDQTSNETTTVILQSQQRGQELSSYSPASCKTNADGMVYFALGPEVFRRPADERVGIVPMTASEIAGLPKRPDPSEHAGCPLNPVAARSFSVTYQFHPERPDRYPANTLLGARQVTLMALTEEQKNSRLESLKSGNQPSHERDFARVKKESPKFCKEVVSGLTSCLEPNTERPQSAWSAKFQADLAHYAAPFGHPFTINCTAWLYMEKQDCNVEYAYTDDTRVAYKFELHELPPQEFIAFDKGLRGKIESMRVTDFEWPQQSAR